MIDVSDVLRLIHPILAITVVFPLVGMVIYFASQTRQRRLQQPGDGKTKIPPSVGTEHLRLGKVLSGSVVVVALIGIGHPILSKWIKNGTLTNADERTRVLLVILTFIVTVLSLVFLYRSRSATLRWLFAAITAVGLAVLGQQPEVFRREFEWWVSHYYFGLIAAFLMIISLAMFPDIYRDRTQTFRKVHIGLNVIALLLFISQGITGSRDLLEIPLGWQEPYIGQLYEQNCQNEPCKVLKESAIPAQPAPTP